MPARLSHHVDQGNAECLYMFHPLGPGVALIGVARRGRSVV
jgi:hypothetical protein